MCKQIAGKKKNKGVITYPSTGVIGNFPTCKDVDPAGYIEHGAKGLMYFGEFVDYETDGNASLCPTFGPSQYNHDEYNHSDCGLVFPNTFTIEGDVGLERVTPPRDLWNILSFVGNHIALSHLVDLSLSYNVEDPMGAIHAF